MRIIIVCAVIVALSAGSAAPAHAQMDMAPADGERIVASDSSARMEELADGVYAIIHEDATDARPHGNTGVVVGRNGVFVVDSTYLPSRARADKTRSCWKMSAQPCRPGPIPRWTPPGTKIAVP